MATNQRGAVKPASTPTATKKIVDARPISSARGAQAAQPGQAPARGAVASTSSGRGAQTSSTSTAKKKEEPKGVLGRIGSAVSGAVAAIPVVGSTATKARGERRDERRDDRNAAQDARRDDKNAAKDAKRDDKNANKADKRDYKEAKQENRVQGVVAVAEAGAGVITNAWDTVGDVVTTGLENPESLAMIGGMVMGVPPGLGAAMGGLDGPTAPAAMPAPSYALEPYAPPEQYTEDPQGAAPGFLQTIQDLPVVVQAAGAAGLLYGAAKLGGFIR